MGNVFFTSDLHLNHTFVAGTRDFDSSEAHDEALIERFNKIITKRDQLWVLGDVFMGSVTEGLKQVDRLNGIKHLVLGNHDAAHPLHKKSHTKQRRFLEVFESVHVHEQHVIHGQKVLLSHFPFQGDHADREDAPHPVASAGRGPASAARPRPRPVGKERSPVQCRGGP